MRKWEPPSAASPIRTPLSFETALIMQPGSRSLFRRRNKSNKKLVGTVRFPVQAGPIIWGSEGRDCVSLDRVMRLRPPR